MANFAQLDLNQFRHNQLTDKSYFYDFDSQGYQMLINGPLAVYSFNPNHWGVYNISGNVAEMIDVPISIIYGREVAITKGGSWFSPVYYLRKHTQEQYFLPSPCVGFRVFKYELIYPAQQSR